MPTKACGCVALFRHMFECSINDCCLCISYLCGYFHVLLPSHLTLALWPRLVSLWHVSRTVRWHPLCIFAQLRRGTLLSHCPTRLLTRQRLCLLPVCPDDHSSGEFCYFTVSFAHFTRHCPSFTLCHVDQHNSFVPWCRCTSWIDTNDIFVKLRWSIRKVQTDKLVEW